MAIIYLPEQNVIEYKEIVIKLGKIINSKRDIKQVTQLLIEQKKKKTFKILTDFSIVFNKLESNTNNI